MYLGALMGSPGNLRVVMVALVALSLSLGAAAWLFQDQLEPVLETVADGLKCMVKKSSGGDAG